MQEQGDLRYFLNQRQKFDIRAVLVLLHRGEVFVAQEKPTQELYILPGGAVKFTEESQNAANREAREELGLTNLNLKFAGILENWLLKMARQNKIFENIPSNRILITRDIYFK